MKYMRVLAGGGKLEWNPGILDNSGKSYSQTETNTNKPKEVSWLPSPPCGNAHDLYFKPSEGGSGRAEG